MNSEQLKAYIKEVPDFPKPGILFKDIAPILASPEAVRAAVNLLSAPFVQSGIKVVAGIESRGFLLGP